MKQKATPSFDEILFNDLARISFKIFFIKENIYYEIFSIFSGIYPYTHHAEGPERHKNWTWLLKLQRSVYLYRKQLH